MNTQNTNQEYIWFYFNYEESHSLYENKGIILSSILSPAIRGTINSKYDDSIFYVSEIKSLPYLNDQKIIESYFEDVLRVAVKKDSRFVTWHEYLQKTQLTTQRFTYLQRRQIDDSVKEKEWFFCLEDLPADQFVLFQVIRDGKWSPIDNIFD